MTSQAQASSAASADGNSPDDAALMREMRLQRNLKIVVGGLGLMILAALAAIAIKIVLLASAPKSATSSGVAAAPPAPGEARRIPFVLPKGARIISTSVSGNRLAIHHEGPAGTGISVIDTDSGATIAEIAPQEAGTGQP